MNCKKCGNPLRYGTKYCSVKCQKELEYETYIQSWLLGREHGIVGGCTTSGYIYRWLREQGEYCWKCGWREVHTITGNIPVEMNHIDGDFENNSPLNLELLCPSCHSLTPTYRRLSKNSKRTNR